MHGDVKLDALRFRDAQGLQDGYDLVGTPTYSLDEGLLVTRLAERATPRLFQWRNADGSMAENRGTFLGFEFPDRSVFVFFEEVWDILRFVPESQSWVDNDGDPIRDPYVMVTVDHPNEYSQPVVGRQH